MATTGEDRNKDNWQRRKRWGRGFWGEGGGGLEVKLEGVKECRRKTTEKRPKLSFTQHTHTHTQPTSHIKIIRQTVETHRFKFA